MLRTITLLFAFLISLNSFGQDARLSQCVEKANRFYDKGHYQNSIDQRIMALGEFPIEFQAASLMAIENTQENIATLLKDCVFMKEGAYDFMPHLSNEEHEFMSSEMNLFLSAFSDLTYYRIDRRDIPGGNSLTASCAMGIADGRRLLIMQGGWED